MEVAKLAGVPESVVRRANVCLRELESQKDALFQTPDLFRQEQAADAAVDPAGQAVLDELSALNPDELTPMAALNYLYELKKRVE